MGTGNISNQGFKPGEMGDTIVPPSVKKGVSPELKKPSTVKTSGMQGKIPDISHEKWMENPMVKKEPLVKKQRVVHTAVAEEKTAVQKNVMKVNTTEKLVPQKPQLEDRATAVLKSTRPLLPRTVLNEKIPNAAVDEGEEYFPPLPPRRPIDPAFKEKIANAALAKGVALKDKADESDLIAAELNKASGKEVKKEEVKGAEKTVIEKLKVRKEIKENPFIAMIRMIKRLFGGGKLKQTDFFGSTKDAQKALTRNQVAFVATADKKSITLVYKNADGKQQLITIKDRSKRTTAIYEVKDSQGKELKSIKVPISASSSENPVSALQQLETYLKNELKGLTFVAAPTENKKK